MCSHFVASQVIACGRLIYCCSCYRSGSVRQYVQQRWAGLGKIAIVPKYTLL